MSLPITITFKPHNDMNTVDHVIDSWEDAAYAPSKGDYVYLGGQMDCYYVKHRVFMPPNRPQGGGIFCYVVPDVMVDLKTGEWPPPPQRVSFGLGTWFMGDCKVEGCGAKQFQACEHDGRYLVANPLDMMDEFPTPHEWQERLKRYEALDRETKP